MAILLTNDDGIDAPGLAALVQALAGLDALVVSAPSGNRSGVGTGISLNRDLRAERRPDAPDGVVRYSVDGTPADAVKFGLQHATAGDRPRLVVSGINKGANVGANIRCSGTLGAAFEAASTGIPALAVSTEWLPEPNWRAAQHFARTLAEKLLSLPREHEPFVLNLNVPSRDPEAVRGLVFARAGRAGYDDQLIPVAADSYRLHAEWTAPAPDSDCDGGAMNAGYAVATPLRVDMTDAALMARLSASWNEAEPYRP